VSGAPLAVEQFVRSIPLFSFIEPQDMTEVLRVLQPVGLLAGDVLFREGEPGKAMWILGEDAEVSMGAAPLGPKRPVAVAYARKGDVIGEMALVDDGPRSATAVVTHDGSAHRIDALEFHAMRSTFVPAAFKILRRVCLDLCRRLRVTNERIVPSGMQDVRAPPLPSGRRPSEEQLDAFPPFRSLPAVVKLALAHKLELYEFEEVTPLFAEGEQSDGAYFLVSGEVSVGRNGKTLANLGAGTMFGVVACIDSGPRSASCLTTGPSTLFRMSKRHFDLLFASGHRFAFQMVDLVARQLVAHVREANQLLPLPGSANPSASFAASRPSAAHPQSAAIDQEMLPVAQAMPLTLEIEMAELSERFP
jgi:CRP-like cAMP-binding protein